MSEKKVAKKTTKTADPGVKRRDAEAEVLDPALEKIAAMPAPFRAMGERLHALILRNAPALRPTLWYGMPAYARKARPSASSVRIRNI